MQKCIVHFFVHTSFTISIIVQDLVQSPLKVIIFYYKIDTFVWNLVNT